MIEINLLPETLRQETKAKKSGLGIDLNKLFYILPAISAMAICIHLYLAILTTVKNSRLKALNNQWQKLAPERKSLEDFNKEYAIISEDASTIQKLSRERISWSEKLNRLSLLLPNGIWFRELSVSRDTFLLQGSALSLREEGMNLIQRLIDNIKNDNIFFKDVRSLELNSVQKRIIAGYDIDDFVLTGVLKSQ